MNRAKVTSANINPVDRVKGLHVHKDEKPAAVATKGWGENTFVAKIVRINGERQTMDVLLVDNAQVLTDIYMTQPYQGPMGFMGIMPEVGASVLLLKTSSSGVIPLTYFIPDVESCNSYALVERFPESVSDDITEPNRVVPSRVRRMRAGEGRLASAHGAEVFLDASIEMENRSSDTFRLRAGDSSAITTSKQNFMFATGVWRSAGPIMRNSLRVSVAGSDIGGIDAKEVTHSDGTKSVYVGGDYGYAGQVRNEYRLEVEDSCRLHRPINDVNENSNITPRKPVVAFTMANMVGNDPNDPSTYGKFLAPTFVSENAGEGRLSFEALTPSAHDDVVGKRGPAWAFSVPDKGFFGFDKQGVKHEYMSESRGTNTGTSQVTVARGGKREEWGAIRENNVSWDLFTKGGIKWVIGKMTDNPEKNKLPRSAEYRYIGGTYTEHGFNPEYNPKILKYVLGDDKGKVLTRADMNTYKRVERVAGNSRDEVDNDRESVVGGKDFIKVSGARRVSVGGAYGESSTGDRTISTLGAFSVNATTEIKILTPKRSEKILNGSDEKKILLGDDSTDIVVGDHKTTVGVGNISRKVGAGDISDTIGVGSRKVNIGAGDYGVSVGAGSMSFSTVGSVSIAGTSVNISSVTTTVDSAFVNLGNAATRSGVITMLSHRDYVTGAPLLPSFTVMAAL